MGASVKKIRVLETIRQGKVGGGESHLISLIENLDRLQFDPIVLSFSDGPMIDRLHALGVENYVIPTEKAFDFAVFKKVRSLLEENAIDVIHAHGTRAFTNVIWAARVLRIPVVYTVHGWSFHDDQNSIVKLIRVWSERFLVRQAQQTISVSLSDQLTGKKRFGTFDSIIINNGIDLEKFNKNLPTKDIRAEYGIEKEALVIGYILRITHQKNPIGMVEAFCQALKQFKDMRLLMIGEGDMKAQVLSRVKELGIEKYVHFDNFRQDVPDILKAIDIYCLPSLWEGLPIGLLEAMAMGKAVIATNVNGSREMVVHGENGLLIEPKDTSALADAIVQLHQQPALREKLQTQARRTVDERYNAKCMTQTVETVYQQIAISAN